MAAVSLFWNTNAAALTSCENALYYCVSVWTPALANYQFQLGVARLSMRSAVSHDTFFKMADNTLSDSDSSWEEGGRLIPFTEEAKIARERKIQTNPVVKNRNKANFKCKQVKEK